MSYTSKRWIGLGLTAALLSTTALAGCGGEGGESGETGETGTSTAAHGEAGEGTPMTGGEAGKGEAGEGEGGEAGHGSMSDLSPAKRAAFMAGHVEAGLALLQAGEAAQASPHLGHPVKETHATERSGLESLGFQKELFQVLLEASENNTAASLDEAAIDAARANLASVITASGEPTKDTIEYLLGVTAEEYAIGVKGGAITDLGEYADAYGFTKVALKLAGTLPDGDAKNAVRQELMGLLDMWPEAGPVMNDAPMSAQLVTSQVSRVRLELSVIE